MADPQQLRCRECGTVYAAGPIYVCEKCFGPLEVIYDYDGLARQPLRQIIESGPPSIWRNEALLPVCRLPDVDLSPGYTPLLRASRLGRALGLSHLYIKNDTVNPTWSFNDRVVAVAVAAALRFQFEVLACLRSRGCAHRLRQCSCQDSQGFARTGEGRPAGSRLDACPRRAGCRMCTGGHGVCGRH